MPSSSSSKLSQVTPSSTTAKRSLTKKKTALDRAKEAGAAAKEEAYLDSLCVRLTCSVILDSFPFGALIGLSIAVFGIIYQLDGLNMSEPILQKYIPDHVDQVMTYTLYGCALIVAVNAFVLFQGIAIFIVVSQRKCCGHKKIGCHCCCQKHENCMATIRKRLHNRSLLRQSEEGDATVRHQHAVRQANQKAIAFFEKSDKNGDGSISFEEFETFVLKNNDQQQILRRATLRSDDKGGLDHNKCSKCCCLCFEGIWAFLGTLFIWVIYLVSAVTTFPATICFCLTFMLEQLCAPFEQKSTEYIITAEVYVLEARIALTESAETARQLLETFRGWKDMTSMFNEGGMGAAMGAMDDVLGGNIPDASGVVGSGSQAQADSVISSNLGEPGNPQSYGAGSSNSGSSGSSSGNNIPSDTSSFSGYGGRRLLQQITASLHLTTLLNQFEITPMVFQNMMTIALVQSVQNVSSHRPLSTTMGSHRMLMSMDGGTGGVDPEDLLLQGLDVMAVLNMTLIDTENQLVYYKHVSSVMSEVCYDMASLNQAIVYILYGSLAILIAEMIVSCWTQKNCCCCCCCCCVFINCI